MTPAGIEHGPDDTIGQDSQAIAESEPARAVPETEANSATLDDRSKPVIETIDAVEAALAMGIDAAAEALKQGKTGALETMQSLAAELRARREARSRVVDLTEERARRGRKG